jgi:hypothetical protein
MPRKTRKTKSSQAQAKIIGDPNTVYEKSENHDGPGRAPASVGFSANPEKFNRFHFTLRYPHNAKPGEGRMISSKWAEPYAAKVFLAYVIGGHEPTWTALNRFITKSGIEVSCAVSEDRKVENELEIALNYKRTKAEQAFELPEKDRKSIDYLLRPYPDVEKLTIGKAKVERAARSKPDGKHITVAQICEELGLEPRDGRAALRKAKFEKPDHGWQFPVGSPEAKAARKIIEKGAK